LGGESGDLAIQLESHSASAKVRAESGGSAPSTAQDAGAAVSAARPISTSVIRRVPFDTIKK
jgi:hypothetical protein